MSSRSGEKKNDIQGCDAIMLARLQLYTLAEGRTFGLTLFGPNFEEVNEVGLHPLSAVECAPQHTQLSVCVFQSILEACPGSLVPHIMHSEHFPAKLMFKTGV